MPVLTPSGHIDTFTRDNLPPEDQWPLLDLSRAQFTYPEVLNVGVELVTRQVDAGFGSRPALIAAAGTLSYDQLESLSNQAANYLSSELGMVPGNRVLIRSFNNPMMVALWLGICKAGGVAVMTMPLLRGGEIAKVLQKAEISLALCDRRLQEEMEIATEGSAFLKELHFFDGSAENSDQVEESLAAQSTEFSAVQTGRDDVVLLGFTSGTTGVPKATMHFHRDLLAIADGYANEILQPTPRDVFIGSPPLAFTFGLGGLAIFPLRFGASSVLLEAAPPDKLLAAIAHYGASIVFSAPTAYKVMIELITANPQDFNISSLRQVISSGETLPAAIYEAWMALTGVPILDGIGATELLHTFIAAKPGDTRKGATGKVIGGYRARIVDDDMVELPIGEIGRLAVQGPTGCRYLADDRQREYVRDGWNLTGDSFRQDREGYFWYVARADDMIISSGYNIAGPEVENALLGHADVAQCAVIGAKDENRGAIVEAHVVLRQGVDETVDKARELQDHVKATIAPYKYPRRVIFTKTLPRTLTGKVQRFKLRKG